ncbi:hypothetical protein OIV83_003881 [Microbotryomycetes sp. JL201]|nr:hypothetical protein OIV83_003881 [Microbotryomycetes sp. JL201]
MDYNTLSPSASGGSEQRLTTFNTIPEDVQTLILQQLLYEASLSADDAMAIEKTLWSLCLSGSRAWLQIARQALYRRPLSGRQAELWRVQALVSTIRQSSVLGAMIQQLAYLGDWILSLHPKQYTEDQSSDVHLNAAEATTLALSLIESCSNLQHLGLPVHSRHDFLPALSEIVPSTVHALTVSGQGRWNERHLESLLRILDGRHLSLLRFHNVDNIDTSIDKPPQRALEMAECDFREPTFSVKHLVLSNSVLGCRSTFEFLLRLSTPKPTMLSLEHTSAELFVHAPGPVFERVEYGLGFSDFALRRLSQDLQSFTFDAHHHSKGSRLLDERSFQSAKWYDIACPVPHASIAMSEYYLSSTSKFAAEFADQDYLADFSWVSDLPFATLDFDLPRLRHLELRCCQGFTTYMMRNIFDHCPALEFVSLANSVWDFNKSMEHILSPSADSSPFAKSQQEQKKAFGFKELLESLRGSSVRCFHMGTLPVTSEMAWALEVDVLLELTGLMSGVKIEFDAATRDLPCESDSEDDLSQSDFE